MVQLEEDLLPSLLIVAGTIQSILGCQTEAPPPQVCAMGASLLSSLLSDSEQAPR